MAMCNDHDVVSEDISLVEKVGGQNDTPPRSFCKNNVPDNTSGERILL
jgi:hypothetical protein